MPSFVFLGIKLGLACIKRGASIFNGGISACGVAGTFVAVVGIGGACIIDSRFNRRASVGLIVLAPRPEALPEMVDWRLLPDDDGVCARLGVPLAELRLPGVLTSGSLGGGWRLFTLFARDCVVAVKVDIRGISKPPMAEGCIVVRRDALLRLPFLARAGFRIDSEWLEGSGWLVFLPSIIDEMSPGPMDLREPECPVPDGKGTGPGGGGPWGAELWRLVLRDNPVLVGGPEPLSSEAKLEAICLTPGTALNRRLRLWLRLTPCSWLGSCLGGGGFPEVKLFPVGMFSVSPNRLRRPPMAGKSLRSGPLPS